MAEKFFSIIITTYNRLEELEKTVDSLLKQSFKDFEVCIMDNNSTEPIKNLEKKGKNIKVFRLNENLAICAINYAQKIAKGKYFILMDNDTHFEKNELKKIHDVILREKAGAIAPKIIQYYYNKEIYLPYYIDGNGKKISPVFNGCCFIISKKIFSGIMNRFGAFHDRKLFIYYGELDAAVKLYKLGEKINFVEEITNFHRWKATQPDRNKKVVDRDFYKYRNYFYLANKYLPEIKKPLIIPLIFVSFLMLSLKNKNPGTFFKGFFAGMKMKTEEKVSFITKQELKAMTGNESFTDFFVLSLYRNLFAKITNKKFF